MINKEKRSLHLLIFFLLSIQTLYACLNYREGVFADQWDLVPILMAYFNEGDWIKQVFSHHGDHFHSAAYLIMLPIAKASNWNLAYELCVILGLNLFSFLVLYKAVLSPLINTSKGHWFAVALMISAMYFSLSHGGNLLWTWQIAVYLVVFGICLTVYGLNSVKNYYLGFTLALLAASTASFSFSSGFAIWPIGVLLILSQHKFSISKRLTLSTIWGLIGSSILLLFLKDTGGSFSQELDFSILRSFTFLLYFLGTPLAYFSRELSLLIAFTSLVSSFFLIYKLSFKLSGTQKKLFYTAISLALFAIITGLLTSLGRVELGFSQARSFRYIVFSQFFWFAFFMLICLYQSIQEKPLNYRSPLWIYLCFCALLLTFNSQKIGRAASKSAQTQHQFWQTFNAATKEEKNRLLLDLNYPDNKTIIEYSSFLQKHSLNYYKID